MPGRRRLPILVLLPLVAGCAAVPSAELPEPAAGPPPDEAGACGPALRDPARLAALPVVEGGGAPAEGGETGTGCRIVVGAVDLADVRLLPEGVITLEGERPAGQRRRVNPKRRDLEARLRELEGGAERTRRAPGTGDPLLDVVGLLGSAVIGFVSDAVSGSGIRELKAELERTPVYVEEPATARYRYEAEAWRLVVEGTAEVALVDGTGRGWSGAVPFRGERLLAIPLSRDPRDSTLPEGVMLVADRAELHRIAHAPPLPHAGELAAGLRRLASGPPRPVDLAALAARRLAALRPAAGDMSAAGPEPAGGILQGERADATGGLDPARLPRRASTSVVRIREGGAVRALAVHVAPDLLLTIAHALPEGSLVPVEDGAGRIAYALVERSDPLADLALLWVPREGPPLPLAGGPTERLTQPAGDGGTPELWLPEAGAPERLGAPVVVDGRLFAIVREDRTRPWGLAGAPLIRRFLDPAPALAARTTPAAASRR